jgi:hypothetical protein
MVYLIIAFILIVSVFLFVFNNWKKWQFFKNKKRSVMRINAILSA